MNIKNRKILIPGKIFVVCALLAGTHANATISLVDQSNSVGGSITNGTLTPGQFVGQSFTPNLAGIDLFEIQASSQGVSTMQIKLFAGETVTGTPIGTSQTITISNSTLQTSEFRFPITVSLVPGSLYTARFDLIAGDSYLLGYSAENPYSRGVAFNELGFIRGFADHVFSEGLASIPEASSSVLFGVALVLVCIKRAMSSNRKIAI